MFIFTHQTVELPLQHMFQIPSDHLRGEYKLVLINKHSLRQQFQLVQDIFKLTFSMLTILVLIIVSSLRKFDESLLHQVIFI